MNALLYFNEDHIKTVLKLVNTINQSEKKCNFAFLNKSNQQY
jgi:hypothetical protein